MLKTHFFNASVDNAVMQHCTLHNTVFFNLKPNFIMDTFSKDSIRLDAPLLAVLVNPDARGVSVPRLVGKLEVLAKVIPIRVSMHADQHRLPLLDAELEQVLQGLNSGPMRQDKVIAQELLPFLRSRTELYSHAMHVLNKAKMLASVVEAVVLPGGEDLPPLLYGQVTQAETGFSGGYHRSLLELALIEQCTHKGVPLMGICRGFQMLSVYCGARLHQHIGNDQIGVRQLDKPVLRDHLGLLPPLMDNLRTAVFHHQAVPADTPLQRLESVTQRTVRDIGQSKDWQVLMAVEQTHGAPVLGFQFHPEFFDEETAEVSPPQQRHSNTVLECLDKGVKTPSDLLRSPSIKHMTTQNEQILALMGKFARTYKGKKQVLSEI